MAINREMLNLLEEIKSHIKDGSAGGKVAVIGEHLCKRIEKVTSASNLTFRDHMKTGSFSARLMNVLLFHNLMDMKVVDFVDKYDTEKFRALRNVGSMRVAELRKWLRGIGVKW